MIDIKKDIKRTLGIDLKIDDIKLGIQQEVASIKHPFKIYEFSTGVGKTLSCLLEMNGKKCLIACSQLLHFESWKNECIKWKIDDSQFEYTAYNSLHKYNVDTYDYLVLDKALSK